MRKFRKMPSAYVVVVYVQRIFVAISRVYDLSIDLDVNSKLSRLKIELCVWIGIARNLRLP